jgi:hypothetical protein
MATVTIVDSKTWELDFRSLLRAVDEGKVEWRESPQAAVAAAERSCKEQPGLGRV